MKSLSEIINETGEFGIDDFNNVSPGLHPSSNYFFNTVEEMRVCLQNEHLQPFYSRGVNPTLRILCEKMAALENKDKALAFASGSAAIAAAVMNSVKKGDHAICVKNPYTWTKHLFENYLPNYGVECTFVDGRDPENFSEAVKENTKLIFLESPNSFYFDMQDLEAISSIAKSGKITTILDNSYASPLNQCANDYGIDMIVHSATKYIGGHSDALGGILCCSEEKYKTLFTTEFMTLGGVMSPWNAWLMIRSLRTLEIRMEKISKTTECVVKFLEGHEKVDKVLYPGSDSYEQNELARKYLKKSGGLFTLKLKTREINKVEKFCNQLAKFKLACSWGSYESLIFPACVTYQGKDKPLEDQNMIRMAIGLEDENLLIQDLKYSLSLI
ncbi:MAG: aminotransferase class V-fold PLP-dependent enzyme [Cytophagales bacterium]